MNAALAWDLTQREPGEVSAVIMPPSVRALSTLSRIDYEDAFLVGIPGAEERTGEEWARRILEGSPWPVQGGLLWGWSTLGVRLGWPSDKERVLGWQITRSEPDLALLGVRSRLGFDAEILFKRQPDAVLFTTFVQQRTPVARALWAGLAPGHQQVVRFILAQAAARERSAHESPQR